MLHVDGLADSADGLLPHMPRERRLEVMSDPTVGAYGVAVTVCVLLLRFAALASMPPSILLIAGSVVWFAHGDGRRPPARCRTRGPRAGLPP